MFPDVEISGEGHLLIWTDDDVDDGYLHTNFKLSASGESISLFDPNLNLVDHIDFEEQTSDISYGRSPDGINNWQLFETPTPGDFNEEISPCPIGDINCDFTINVLDVVLMVNIIIEFTDFSNLADINADNLINVLDVVLLVNMILGE